MSKIRSIAGLFFLSLVFSCSAPDQEPHCSTNTTATAPRTETWMVDLRSISDSTMESSVLRAMAWWEERTQGRVKFRAMQSNDDFDCDRIPTVRVFQDLKNVSSEAETLNDVVGIHQKNLPGQKCELIAIDLGWAGSPEYKALYDRMKVNPFASIAAHELGHVLQLAHSSPEDRSIMSPSVKNSKVTGPSCQDVSFLSEKWGEQITCREKAE